MINDKNKLQNKCNKKQVVNQESMNIYDDDDVCEMIKEVHRRDKYDKELDIGLVFEYEHDKYISENEEESSGNEL